MAVTILPIHKRLAELFLKNKQRALTVAEMQEIQHCLTENATYCWKMAHYENLSLLASMTNDVDWQHEICLDIDKLGSRTNRRQKKRDDTQ